MRARGRPKAAPTVKTHRERWLRKPRRRFGTAPGPNFCNPRAQWPGGNLDQPLRFCAPEMFCPFQGVTPVTGSGESGPMDLGKAQRSRSPSAASPAILWLLSQQWESNPHRRAELSRRPQAAKHLCRKPSQRPDEGIGPYRRKNNRGGGSRPPSCKEKARAEKPPYAPQGRGKHSHAPIYASV